MCGIVGGWLANMEPSEFQLALRSLRHRGPDDQGEFFDTAAGVALCHVRLSIIDLSSAGHQPMLSLDGDVALIFNGEIYNYRDLRSSLESDGTTFHGRSDTEVLLQLYLRDGVSALSRINGIFALAIYDRRSSELHLARDAMGVKPLYIMANETGVAFASEIKALLPLLRSYKGLNHESLHRYLSYLWCPGAGTLFDCVRKLGPGEAMTVKCGNIERCWRWYELPARRGVRGQMGEAEAVAAVRHGLRVAVERQLVADVPVGAFLSGGLDSSAIVAFARERSPAMHCFTIAAGGGGEAGETEDLPYAQRVAKHIGVSLDVVKVDASRIAGDLVRMIWHLDEPLADLAALNVFYISELARRQGIKVLLSGTGGDDLFAGYRRHLALQYDFLWRRTPRSLLRCAGSIGEYLGNFKGLRRRIARLLISRERPGNVRLVDYFAWMQPEALSALYSDEARLAIGDARAEQPMIEFLDGIPSAVSDLQCMLALEQRFFLADHNLTYTDKMSMAAGVEVRVPFLDLDLVELSSKIPDRFKQRGHVGKWVLKKAMEPYLPRDIIYRSKSGFGVPLRRWIKAELRELLGDILSEHSVRNRGLFDPIAVRKLIEKNNSGRIDAAYTLLSLLCVEIWCRIFIDGNRCPPC